MRACEPQCAAGGPRGGLRGDSPARWVGSPTPLPWAAAGEAARPRWAGRRSVRARGPRGVPGTPSRADAAKPSAR